jgi:hypothetical protein
MGEKRIGTREVVVIVVGVVVAVVIVGVFLLPREEPLVYPGATPTAMPAELGALEAFGSAYAVTASAQEIVEWYKTHAPAQGWNLEREEPRALMFLKDGECFMVMIEDEILVLIRGTEEELQQAAREVVEGLYIPYVRAPLAGDVDATIHDYNENIEENYKNGNIGMTVIITSGEMRSIADPEYGGTTVTVLNKVTGFTASVSFPDNTDKWGMTLEGSTRIEDLWGPGHNAIMEVRMSPTSAGELGVGSAIIIRLYPEEYPDARAGASERMAWPTKWDEGDSWVITITGRDPLTVDVYRLYGASWAA